MAARTSIREAAGAAPRHPLTIQMSSSVLIARRYFACFIAELVEIPRADDHIDLRYHLLVGSARSGSAALLPEKRFVLNLDG